jgi:hypothetical protein
MDRETGKRHLAVTNKTVKGTGARLACARTPLEMTAKVQYYTPLLEEAIAEAKAAGFEPEASELEHACFKVVFTTSTEMLGEHVVAINRFLKTTRGRLPVPIKKKLYACLAEGERAWPGWRSLWSALMRRLR